MLRATSSSRDDTREIMSKNRWDSSVSNLMHKKIWMISASFYPWIGGAERQLQRIAKLLVADEYSLTVLTRKHREGLPENLPGEDMVDGIPVTRVDSRGQSQISSLLFLVRGLWHLFEHGRGDIYHANGPGAPAWLAVLAHRLLGGASVIKVRSGTHNYTHLYLSNWWRAWLFAIPLRLASLVWVVSEDGMQLVRRLGISEERIIWIPNGIDISFFHPASKEQKIAARSQLGFAAGKTIVLCVSRLSLATKDIDTLIQAWAQLPDDVQEKALLTIVGDGPDRGKLEHLVDCLDVEKSVSIIGSRDEIRDYYWAADIFILPSRDEGLSNALLEAMACGLPVVASSVGGTPDVVQQGKNGLLYQAEDPSQLAQQLSSMIQMQYRWNEMGMHGRNMVSSYASLNVVVSRFKEIYSFLASR